MKNKTEKKDHSFNKKSTTTTTTTVEVVEWSVKRKVVEIC